MTIVIIAAGTFSSLRELLSRCNPNQSAPWLLRRRRNRGEKKRKTKRCIGRNIASHHVRSSHRTGKLCRARETDSNQFFFLPMPIRPSLFSLSRSQMYPHRAASKRKYMYRSGRSLFVRDCETRFLRKRREKLQSRFVERFDWRNLFFFFFAYVCVCVFFFISNRLLAIHRDVRGRRATISWSLCSRGYSSQWLRN